MIEITEEEARELYKFLSKQFIDLNSKKLYDGTKVYLVLRKCEEYGKPDTVPELHE